MKAMVQDKYGSAEVLELRDIDKPDIGDHDVLVGVRAAAVNPADWAIMSGLPYIARMLYGLRKPKTGVRGTDVAGEVEAVGTSVTRFRPGDEVFGWCSGAFAEYASVSEDALEDEHPLIVPQPGGAPTGRAARPPDVCVCRIRSAPRRTRGLLGDAGEVAGSAVVVADIGVRLAVGVGQAAIGQVGRRGVAVGQPTRPVGQQGDQAVGELVEVVIADVQHAQRDSVW